VDPNWESRSMKAKKVEDKDEDKKEKKQKTIMI
jgi:hypothetical protein